MFKYIVAMMMLVSASFAQADTFGLHIGSKHFSDQKYNNFNPGVYWRHDSGFTAGFYKNSFSNISTYAGWTLETDSKRFAVTAGLVTGYTRNTIKIEHPTEVGPEVVSIEKKKVIRPMIVFSTKLTDNVRLSFAPARKDHSVALVHLSVEF